MPTSPTLSETLTRLGGVARREQLVALHGRSSVDRALAAGELTVLTRGTYASVDVGAARAAAAAVSGVLSLRSAALDLGWAVWTEPDRPDVTVPRKRRLSPDRVDRLTVHRADLRPDEVSGGRTPPDRTIVDCLRHLPFVEAIAVGDSALRGCMARDHLLALAQAAAGPGSVEIRRVASLLDGRAANPFESALRAICLGVEGLEVAAQVDVRAPHWLGRPDLVDERLGLAIEADSFEWHGDRAALHRDANRYNAFTAAGWLVLRFSWEEVRFHPERVRAVLEAVVARWSPRHGAGCRAA